MKKRKPKSTTKIRDIALEVSDEVNHHKDGDVTAKRRAWYVDHYGNANPIGITDFTRMLHQEFEKHNIDIEFFHDSMKQNKWGEYFYEVKFRVL